jgi:DNA processing protein
MSIRIDASEFATHPLLSRVLHLYDVPKSLYIEGTLPEITLDAYGNASPRIITIVGSRKYTEYGKAVVEHLVGSLSGYDVIIISGLALGIDSIAHKTALKYNIPTIAVPGSGLSERSVYPASNRFLAKDITASGGCLISELSDDTKASPWTFPARNRIMATLSDVTLIIEAEEKSGTLITARLALELGKDIGAVPGNIFSETAKGPLALIRDGATPVTSPEDLFELLRLQPKEKNNTTDTLQKNLSEQESLILSLLREPKKKDALLEQSGLTLEEFLITCSMLEIKGCIEETFGELRKIV